MTKSANSDSELPQILATTNQGVGATIVARYTENYLFIIVNKSQ